MTVTAAAHAGRGNGHEPPGGGESLDGLLVRLPAWSRLLSAVAAGGSDAVRAEATACAQALRARGVELNAAALAALGEARIAQVRRLLEGSGPVRAIAQRLARARSARAQADLRRALSTELDKAGAYVPAGVAQQLATQIFGGDAAAEHAEATPAGAARPRDGDVTPVSVELLRGDAVVMRPVRWIWRGWLAAGKVHILAGRAGAGKTTLALAMAATVTVGGRWPDGTRADPGHVIIWSGEDDAGDTLLPRLAAMGADLRRVHIVGRVTDADGPRPFDPSIDIPALRAAIREIGEPATFGIIDPVVQAVAGDAHRANEVRRALAPVVELADSTGLALVGISHFAKFSTGQNPTERVVGSQAFGAVARVVMVAAKRDESANSGPSRVLARAKSNIGPDDGGFEYELAQVPVPGQAGMFATAVRWGGALQGTARELLADAEAADADDQRSATDEAAEFLTTLLAGGPMRASDVQREARAAGIGEKPLRTARERLGIRPRKRGMVGGWWWSLPGPEDALTRAEDAEDAQDALIGKMGIFGDRGHLRDAGPDPAGDLEAVE